MISLGVAHRAVYLALQKVVARGFSGYSVCAVIKHEILRMRTVVLTFLSLVEWGLDSVASF